MATKHTLGPWKIADSPKKIYNVLLSEDDHHIATIYKTNYSNLIAAAPDLLGACKAAKKYLEPDLVEPGRTVFWKLVAAIKKVEGR